jgi:threonine aldolase
MDKRIDFRSDTVTLPTEEMMRAIAVAELGDDVYGDDLSTVKLERYAAELFGKEDGMLVSSGTMGNLVATLTFTQHRRAEIIAEVNSHMVDYEGGNIAHFGGVSLRALEGKRGVLTPEQVEGAIRDPDNLHHPITSLICVENTHANYGGTVITVEDSAKLRQVADRFKIPMHLDGARIFNASVALGRSVAELCSDFDSVQFCLSKGLSAPVGSILVGDKDFIKEARHYRKMLGGGMRQCGIIAAAGMVALTKMIPRLQDDHDNARSLAEGLNRLPGLEVDLDGVQTNIVRAHVASRNFTASKLVELFESCGVRCLARGPRTLRFLLHRHIAPQDIDTAIKSMERVILKNMV